MPKTYLIAIVILSLGLVANVEARGFRVGFIPNGSTESCSNCHNNPGGGGPRTTFGEDVRDLVSPGGFEQFWDLALALEDSDGDGFSNGLELGDIDGDGEPERTVNISNPGDPNASPETALGDCNLDTELDADDLSCVSDVAGRDAVLDALNTLPGDFDGNQRVDFNDFLVLSTNFGSDSLAYTDGNANLSGGIDFNDFLVLSTNFGQTASAAASAVPEPTGSSLAMLGLLLACGLRRRRV